MRLDWTECEGMPSHSKDPEMEERRRKSTKSSKMGDNMNQNERPPSAPCKATGVWPFHTRRDLES